MDFKNSHFESTDQVVGLRPDFESVCMFNFDFNLYSSIVGNSNAFL